MSRYTEEDLKGLNRPALLQLVLRQPNVPIPPKFIRQPLTALTKDELRKLLAGPFGFVKEEPHEQDDVSMEEQVPHRPQFGMNHLKKVDACGETQPIQDVFMREQRPTEAELKEPTADSDQFRGDASMLEEATEIAQVLVRHSPRLTISHPPELLVDNLGELDSKSVELPINKHTSTADDDLVSTHSKTDRSPSLDNPAYTPSTSIASAPPSNKMDDCEPNGNETGELPSTLHKIVASLEPDVAIAVRVYFMTHPKDVKVWQSIHLARKKKKPDFAVIRYICQVLNLYNTLKSHPWPTDTGTLRTKDLEKVIGFSASWFTNARHIREEYNKVGPESGRTNDAIVARFQEKVANKKSSDLLSFLRAQREIIEGKAI